MPNHVKCKVVFLGQKTLPPTRATSVESFVRGTGGLSFDRWVPRPPNLLSQYQRTHRDLAEALGERQAEHLDEIAWMRREWGAPGDGYSWEYLPLAASEPEVLTFQTAWSPPLPVFLAMAKLEGPLRACWYEEFGHSAGHLLFDHDAQQGGIVVATEVVKLNPSPAPKGAHPRKAIGRRFVQGSLHDYLTSLRDDLWGAGSDVPVLSTDHMETT